MGKNVGLTYGEFKFPKEQGFTGSAGSTEVKGYMRGGAVKGRNKPNTRSKRAKGTTKAAHGGFMGPEREITVDDVTISTPRARGGKVSMHDKLKSEGKKLGYAYGGRVKYGKSGNTSGEFKMKKSKMDSMDHGVQPARRGKNARNQAEAEAGGTGRLKPGLAKGGKVGRKGGKGRGALAEVAARGIKKIKGTMSDADRAHARRIASGRGMPSTVKAKGGRAKKYATGGPVGKRGAAQ